MYESNIYLTMFDRDPHLIMVFIICGNHWFFFLNNIEIENKKDTEECAKVEEFHNTVKSIIEVLSRDHMKVAFFGR